MVPVAHDDPLGQFTLIFNGPTTTPIATAMDDDESLPDKTTEPYLGLAYLFLAACMFAFAIWTSHVLNTLCDRVSYVESRVEYHDKHARHE